MKRPTHRVNRPVKSEPKVRTPTGSTPTIGTLTYRARRQATAEAQRQDAAVAARRAALKVV